MAPHSSFLASQSKKINPENPNRFTLNPKYQLKNLKAQP